MYKIAATQFLIVLLWPFATHAQSDQYTGETQLVCKGPKKFWSVGSIDDVSKTEEIIFRVTFETKIHSPDKPNMLPGYEEMRLWASDKLFLGLRGLSNKVSCSGYKERILCEFDERMKPVLPGDPLTKGTPLENRGYQNEQKLELKIDRLTGIMDYELNTVGNYTNPTQRIKMNWSGTFQCERATTKKF